MKTSKIYVATTILQTMSHETPLVEFEDCIIGDMDKVQALVSRALADSDYEEKNALDALYDRMGDDDEVDELMAGADEIAFSELVNKAKNGNLMAISAILSGHPTCYTGWINVYCLGIEVPK